MYKYEHKKIFILNNFLSERRRCSDEVDQREAELELVGSGLERETSDHQRDHRRHRGRAEVLLEAGQGQRQSHALS